MAIIFNGKIFASRRQEALKSQIKGLRSRGVNPKLATIMFSNDKTAAKYVDLKSKLAGKVGAELDIFEISSARGADYILRVITTLNRDPSVHGVMVQLPIPYRLKQSTKKILNSILPKKDVDGLRDESPYMSATVKAITHILDEAQVSKKDSILVVGSEGEVGKRVIKYLSLKGYAVDGVDKKHSYWNDYLKVKGPKAEVLICATGKPGLITADLVKPNAVIIDVGAPIGDVDFKTVSKIVRFITPVPGGVGPVTVVSLFENLVEVASLNK